MKEGEKKTRGMEMEVEMEREGATGRKTLKIRPSLMWLSFSDNICGTVCSAFPHRTAPLQPNAASNLA